MKNVKLSKPETLWQKKIFRRKDKVRSTWINEYHIWHKISSKINKKYEETSKESKRPQIHSNYLTHLSDIINADPSSYEEVARTM